jgi:hypothetical protein
MLMRDRDEQKSASSSRQKNSRPAANGSKTERTSASGTQSGNGTATATKSDEISLSRRWGGPGATVNIFVAGRNIGSLLDWRFLWGFHHGGDGYNLLPVVHVEGDDRTLSFNVPATSTPGMYVVQLEHDDKIVARLPFAVTPSEPPVGSPFNILRTEPPVGTLRMYQSFCRYRSNQEKAIEEVTDQMKGYDTFLEPMPDDPTFKEILSRTQTPYERRKRFATWLVTNQLKAEHGA